MEYLTEDLVLSGLSLPDPCAVRIKTTDKYVYLFIGMYFLRNLKGISSIKLELF